MVDSTFDSTILQNQLVNGGDLEAFENLLLNGQFDQKLTDEGLGDQEIKNYVRSVKENITKIASIHQAIKEGNIRQVKNLIDRKKLIAARGANGRNALTLAIICDQKEIAEYLIDSYPKCINQQDQDGRTAMHYAAIMTDPTIYQLLIGKSGDITLMDTIGHTPEFYKQHPDELLIMESV